MFTKALRLGLYVLLFSCFIWGTVLLAGPSLLKYMVATTFGDTVILYNLRVTPKLKVLVSRIDITDARTQGIILDGSIRSVEIKIKDFFKLKPMLSISIGPSQLNQFGSIGKADANIYFPAGSFFSKGNIELELIELTSKNTFSSDSITISGIIDFRNGSLVDAKLAAQNFEENNDFYFSFPSLQGSLSNWYFFNDNIVLPEAIKMELPEVKFPLLGVHLKDTSINSELSGDKYNIIFNSGKVYGDNNGYLAEGVSADILVERYNARIIQNMKLDIYSLNLVSSSFLENGEVIDLSMLLSKNSDSNYDLVANGRIKGAELMINKLPVVDLSGSSFKIATSHMPKNDISSTLNTALTLFSENKNAFSLNADASIELNERDAMKCLAGICVFSNFFLNYDLVALEDRLKGNLSCSIIPCKGENMQHRLQTINTASFFESVKSLEIFNPVFLVFLYRNLLAGQKIGLGHSLKF